MVFVFENVSVRKQIFVKIMMKNLSLLLLWKISLISKGHKKGPEN